MKPERWQELMDNDDAVLTTEEWEEGWHFCLEFDGLLVGPGCVGFEDGRCICGFREEGNA